MPEGRSLDEAVGPSLEVLVTALGEYAGKLRAMCDEWRGMRARRITTVMLAIAVSFFGIGGLGILHQAIGPGYRTIYVLGFTMVMVGSLLFITDWFFRDAQRMRQVRGEIFVAAEQVGRLIKLGSQFEHFAESVNKKIMLDLRLAEAEGALRYSTMVVGEGVARGTSYKRET